MVIYCITNLVNGKKYIGQTVVGIKTRWQKHMTSTRCNSNQAIHCAIRKHGVDNFTIEEIDTADTHELLDEAETAWIAHYDTFLGEGYNMTSGGGGKSGYRHSEESKQKNRESNSGENSYWYGRKHPPEFGKKISERQTGSKNHRYGKTQTPEHTKNQSEAQKISVSQFTKDGIFIKTFKSAKDAGEELKIFPNSITGVCKKRKGFLSAGGYIWRYADA